MSVGPRSRSLLRERGPTDISDATYLLCSDDSCRDILNECGGDLRSIIKLYTNYFKIEREPNPAKPATRQGVVRLLTQRPIRNGYGSMLRGSSPPPGPRGPRGRHRSRSQSCERADSKASFFGTMLT